MLKEIYEQPSVIRIPEVHANKGIVQMSGVEDNLENSSMQRESL
jgi:glucosamine--fructose-6-phosphate aminotransferase (isomerizing)